MFFLRAITALSFLSLSLGQIPFEDPILGGLTDPLTPLREVRADGGYRLNNETKPLRYEVLLTTNIHAADVNFTGVVQIELTVINETNFIQLNYKQIEFNLVRLFDSNNNPLSIRQHVFDPEHQFVNIILNGVQTLKPNQNYTLEISYHGTLRTDSLGFYRSSYVNSGDVRKYLGATQFEAAEARHAFPCYDEPYIRTPWKIRIKHHKSYTAISNMPGQIEGEPDDDGMVTTSFDETPPVQSYLIAFVISDFPYIEDVANKQRVFARPQAIAADEADWALEVGVKTLQNQEEYLKTKFDLPKMDQISLPDFYYGAMENWGLVTYTETSLLYDPKRDPLTRKRGILSTIGHEFGHQFFGDHVAPKWWSYNWLNEGFATLMQYVTGQRTYPEFREGDRMLIDAVQSSFVTDSYESTRPMTYYIEVPDQIMGIFDNIAYSKSGSVLRMWLHALTEKTFVKGLTYYLEDMKFKAADSDDLARNLQKAATEDRKLPAGVEMKTIVDSWSLKKGYPYVFVERIDDQIRLTQKRFLFDKEDTTSDTWWIPYSFATASRPNFEDTSPDGWMMGAATLLVNQTGTLKWNTNDYVILNKQQTGYYRVNYDAKGWELITSKLQENASNIHLLNRGQLVDDSFYLARSGRLEYKVPFSLSLYLRQELDLIPWTPANIHFTYFNRMLGASSDYYLFKDYIRELVTPLYQSLGAENSLYDVVFDRQARSIAISWACLAGNADCLHDTTELIRKANTNSTAYEIPIDLRETVYCNGLRAADNATWLKVWSRMYGSTASPNRAVFLRALACSEDLEILEYYLSTTLNYKVEYKNSDRSNVLSSVYQSGAPGLELSIDFLDQHYESVEKIYGENSTRAACSGMSSRIVGEEQNERFTALLDKLIAASVISQQNKATYLNNAKVNLDWIARNGKAISDFFLGYYRGSASGVFVSLMMLILPTFLSFLMM